MGVVSVQNVTTTLFRFFFQHLGCISAVCIYELIKMLWVVTDRTINIYSMNRTSRLLFPTCDILLNELVTQLRSAHIPRIPVDIPDDLPNKFGKFHCQSEARIGLTHVKWHLCLDRELWKQSVRTENVVNAPWLITPKMCPECDVKELNRSLSLSPPPSQPPQGDHQLNLSHVDETREGKACWWKPRC